MKFVFDAPRAGHVSLVGDFNDWDQSATPMTRSSDGSWTVSLPIEPGRHVYAFVLDGTRWMPDPTALLAPDDGFGARNSIVLVSKKGPST
jgi:1,4-alpha-glucan branching enzyme